MVRQPTEIISDHLPPQELEAVEGKAFFYPCSGPDRRAALHALAPWLSTFTFCDVNYGSVESAERDMPPGYTLWNRRVLKSERDARSFRNGRESRPPLLIRETYVSDPASSVVTVHLWRARAEDFLLDEFPHRSIGIFMHRSDGTGEGGSNLHFLRAAEDERFCDPEARLLFRELAPRLANRALILTDGSNASPRELWAVDLKEPDDRRIGTAFERWGFRWTCIGRLAEPRGGWTYAWRVERLGI